MASITFHGLIKLHFAHLVFACIPLMNLWITAGYFRNPIERTTFPDTPVTRAEFNSIRSVLPGDIALNALVMVAAFTVIVVEAVRQRAIPLGCELLWVTVSIMLQAGVVALHLKVVPRALLQLSKNPLSPGYLDENGKMAEAQAATSISIAWQLTILFAVTTIVLMSIHVLWHTIVAFRHLSTHPRVLIEPTPSSWLWTLPEPAPKQSFASKYPGHVQVKIEFSHAVVVPPPMEFKTFMSDAKMPQPPATVWGKARTWFDKKRTPTPRFETMTGV